jgi:hypothetical protein
VKEHVWGQERRHSSNRILVAKESGILPHYDRYPIPCPCQ